MVLEMVIMKRYNLFILSLFLLLSTLCNAQEQQQVTVKDYSAYLPKSGDVAISANLNPLATYAGQFFNGTLANSLKEFGGQPYYNNDVRDYNVLPADLISISLKYMVTDNFATRINFGYGLMLINNKQYVYDDAALAIDPFSQAKVIDTYRITAHRGSVYLGGEYRIGKGRLQGVFSAGINYVVAQETVDCSYGNAMTDINQNPSIADAGYNVILPDKSGMINGRYIDKYSFYHGIGVSGGVGIEYFVAPKISLGAEVNLSLLCAFKTKDNYTAEAYNTISGKPDVWVQKVSPVSVLLDFGTSNIGANFTINFYISR